MDMGGTPHSAAVINRYLGIAARKEGEPAGSPYADWPVGVVANLAVAARWGIEPAPSLAHKAFEVAQWASQSSAAAAIQLSISFASSPVGTHQAKLTLPQSL